MVYGMQGIPGMVASAIADKAIKSCNLPDLICSLLYHVDDEDYAASKFVWSVSYHIAVLHCTGQVVVTLSHWSGLSRIKRVDAAARIYSISPKPRELLEELRGGIKNNCFFSEFSRKVTPNPKFPYEKKFNLFGFFWQKGGLTYSKRVLS